VSIKASTSCFDRSYGACKRSHIDEKERGCKTYGGCAERDTRCWWPFDGSSLDHYVLDSCPPKAKVTRSNRVGCANKTKRFLNLACRTDWPG
jgi:hypothetical protein